MISLGRCNEDKETKGFFKVIQHPSTQFAICHPLEVGWVWMAIIVKHRMFCTRKMMRMLITCTLWNVKWARFQEAFVLAVTLDVRLQFVWIFSSSSVSQHWHWQSLKILTMDYGSLLMKLPIISEWFTDDNRSNFSNFCLNLCQGKILNSCYDLIVWKLAFSKYCVSIEHNIDAKVREPWAAAH